MTNPIAHYIRRNAEPYGPVILMYHSISPNRSTPSWPWAVSLTRFRSQLDLLVDSGYTTTTISDLVNQSKELPKRTAVITFDDGYIDNLLAIEELTRRGMHATWFVVTGSIGCEPSWQSDGRPSGRLLNEEELRAMNATGMEIASHTVSHRRLTTVDDNELIRELADSKSTLEDILGHDIMSFAYPFGTEDKRCEAAVKQAGYRAACTTDTGWALIDMNPFRLRRLTVFNTDTALTLGRKLAFASNDVSWSTMAHYWLQRFNARLFNS